MGGRGNAYGSGDTTISPLAARVAFNSAKKSSGLLSDAPDKRDRNMEKAIRSGSAKLFESINTEKEARRAVEYLMGRKSENERKIVNLGSAEKLRNSPQLYNERKSILRLLDTAEKKVQSLRDTSDFGRRNVEIKHTITTYDRARKQRMKNFDEWFGKR